MSIAAELLAKFRTLAPITSGATVSNTKSPISEADQPIVRDHIRRNAPPWLAVYHDIAMITGWRTADVCGLTYDCIDWSTGKVTITVAKQTKAAQARALAKAIEAARRARKAAAVAVGDSAAYMQWDAADRDTVAADMTEQEQEQAALAVAGAARKVDTKQLPAGLLKRLEAMREMNHHDEFIFSRTLTRSNRSKSLDGSISRQTVWALMREVFDTLADKLSAPASKLSAYSFRKAFALNMLKRSGSVAVVMQAFGHSSVQMTMRYLGLASEAEAEQAAMAGAVTWA